MCNRQNLPNRVAKARAALKFAKVTQCDSDGRIRAAVMPGTEGKQYHIILRRNPLSVELNLIVSGDLVKPHYAHQTITYHGMATVMMAAEEAGYDIAWCASERDADRLENLGGTKFVLRNRDNTNLNDRMYGVMYD